MVNSYDSLNNLSEISFVAGTEKLLTFTVYNEDGVTLLNISSGSATWKLCQYGEFQTTILTKTGTVINANQFTVLLDPVDTETLSGKYIQQIIVIDNSGKTFVPGQGIIIISPSA
jgi:hypothetical protein